jgi:LacI family transcriptional regulator
MAVTIYEVAAHAGVSPATVSRVLNGGAVSPEYAQRVRESAEALRYRPNRTARSLRRQQSDMIALIIPDIENPFFTSLARGVEDKAMAFGLSVVLCNTDERPEKEARYLDMVLSGRVAGIVLAPASTSPELGALIEQGIPVVTVDRMAHGFPVDAVLMDDEDTVRPGVQPRGVHHRARRGGHRRAAGGRLAHRVRAVQPGGRPRAVPAARRLPGRGRTGRHGGSAGDAHPA